MWRGSRSGRDRSSEDASGEDGGAAGGSGSSAGGDAGSDDERDFEAEADDGDSSGSGSGSGSESGDDSSDGGDSDHKRGRSRRRQQQRQRGGRGFGGRSRGGDRLGLGGDASSASDSLRRSATFTEGFGPEDGTRFDCPFFHRVGWLTCRLSCLNCSDGDWEELQIPSAYLQKNWPVVRCAVSESGQQVRT